MCTRNGILASALSHRSVCGQENAKLFMYAMASLISLGSSLMMLSATLFVTTPPPDLPFLRAGNSFVPRRSILWCFFLSVPSVAIASMWSSLSIAGKSIVYTLLAFIVPPTLSTEPTRPLRA